jgi:preprotein translocase subunit SecE
VNDERQDGDAAGIDIHGNQTEERSGGRTAVATQPQRPTGKRSRHRANTRDGGTDVDSSARVDVAEDRGAKVKKEKKAKKAGKSRGPNPIVYVYDYLKQVVDELRKVIWPNRKEMVTYTSVVLVFLVFMAGLIALADFGLAKLVLVVFS